MSSSDLPSGAPVASGDAGTRLRWPSRQQALGLVGAFLVGACLCGAAGLCVGAVAGNHKSDYGPGRDGRDGFDRRDDDERFRRDFWPYPMLPAPATTAPAAPAPSPSPSPTRSVSPSPSVSPTPSTSPS
jgi:hypothetical protein